MSFRREMKEQTEDREKKTKTGGGQVYSGELLMICRSVELQESD